MCQEEKPAPRGGPLTEKERSNRKHVAKIAALRKLGLRETAEIIEIAGIVDSEKS